VGNSSLYPRSRQGSSASNRSNNKSVLTGMNYF
jgi:hypothetical protein